MRDVTLSANLDKDQVGITLSAISGSGRLEGEGVALLKGWQLDSYRGIITGDRFQLIHLPELEASGSPQLSFDGTMKNWRCAERCACRCFLFTGSLPVPASSLAMT